MQPYLDLFGNQMIAALLMVAAAFAITAHMIRARREKLGRLGDLLPGRVEGYFPPRFVGELEEMSFRISLLPGSKYSPPTLMLEVSTHASFELTVSKEGALTGIGSRLGLLKDIQTPDPEFNKQFLLGGDQAGLAARFLSEERWRAEIRDLLGAGYNKLTIDSAGVKTYKHGYSEEQDLTPSAMADRIKRLAALAKAARMY